MDPASLALESVTSLLSALALLFSRLDARRDGSETFDIRNAVIELSLAIHAWGQDARMTDSAVTSWVESSNRRDLKEELTFVRDARISQMATSDEVLAALKKPKKSQLKSLRPMLDLYAPELAQVLEHAFSERRALLNSLMVELPRKQRSGREELDAYVGQLHTASDLIMEAEQMVASYIRLHFPIGAI